MEGEHQHDNARLALAALRVLGASPRALDAALNATHPGRLERFRVRGRDVLLDGAHNAHAAHALAHAVGHAVGHADTLLFGAFGRKAVTDMLAHLRGIARAAVYTTPGELAADPHALARDWKGAAAPDPDEALRLALDLTPEGGLLLVTGSLHLVGRLRPRLLAPREEE